MYHLYISFYRSLQIECANREKSSRVNKYLARGVKWQGECQNPMLDLFWQLGVHLDWPDPRFPLMLSAGLF